MYNTNKRESFDNVTKWFQRFIVQVTTNHKGIIILVHIHNTVYNLYCINYSEVAVKREGSQIPLPINTMQEPVHPKAVSNDFVNLSKNPQKLNEARPAEVLCKNKFRRLQRKV